MFNNKAREKVFEHEVLLEIEFLQKRYGDDALRIAEEKAVRPENRTRRRQVLEEVARRLAGRSPSTKRGILSRLLGV